MSRYAVVKFLPNVDNGECINVGLVLWNEDRIMWKFLSETNTRLCVFAGDFNLSGMFKILNLYSKMTSKELEAFIKKHHEAFHPVNLVISEPNGTLGSVDDKEMDELAKAFLVEK